MSFNAAELRHAARGLFRTPTISVSAIICLTLGIGATTAIASAISRALLNQLPFTDPARLVAVHRVTPQSGPFGTWPTSAANYLDMGKRSRTIDSLAAMTPGGGLVTLQDEAIQVQQLYVTGNLFTMLGAHAARGRLIQAGDDKPDASAVAVVSSEFWTSRLGADSSIIGRTLLVDGKPTTVVGVAPPEMRVPHGSRIFRADLWMPLSFTDNTIASRRSNFLFTLGRLRAGVTSQAADAEMRSVFNGIVEENPQLRGEGVRVAALQAENVNAVRKPLLLVFGAVALVLLIACTNVAALLLARGVQRQRELAIRSALGASRWDTMRLTLLESVLITGVGTSLGLLLAVAGIRTIGRLASARIPQLAGLSMDARVIGFAIVLAVIVAIVCGAVPAWRGAHANPPEALGSNRGSGAGRAHHRALRILVAGEIATSLILLIGAGLLLKTFSQLMNSNPGFDSARMVTLQLTASPQQYKDRLATTALLQPIIEQVKALPGVQGVGAISAVPYVSWGNNSNIRYEGVPGDDPTRLPLVEQRGVSPSFFEATGQRLVSGRLLTGNDDANAPYTVVVNEALVARDFGGKNPVGKRFHVSDTVFGTIVGVVSDIRNAGPFSPPAAEMYSTYQQVAPGTTNFGLLIRVERGDPMAIVPQVREVIRRVDPTAAIAKVSSMREVIATSLGSPRFYLSLLGTFAIVALVLSIAGLYGILSYSVLQRTREFGIRLALGSRPSLLLRMVTTQGMLLVCTGLLVGLVGAAAVVRLMDSMLFGLSPLDPSAWVVSCALMLVVGTIAAVVPAHRATRVDPVRAIQTE